ncbi:MAG: hypothetical protein ETSY2_26460 [Candidatus Entotheonella gemina]|uniref:Uncharacterized protein n=1 Tax=Candidatus Entotheonella gemina TaxID=1429439 RepID=W4M4I7_9BACT|nr:MAG: hypothetical protein ETSY2_26460 [Candidatus Entotheonella gemina]
MTSALDHDAWTLEKNARRCELIDKDIAGTVTEVEKSELNNLQKQAISWRDRVAPLPVEGARKLYQELLKKQHSGSQG